MAKTKTHKGIKIADSLKARRTLLLLDRHIYKFRGKPAIDIPNSRLNFKETYIIKSITASGNIRLGEITALGPEMMRTKDVIGKVVKSGSNEIIRVGRGTGTNILRLG